MPGLFLLECRISVLHLDDLGVGGILIASMFHFGSQGNGLSLHEVLVTLFLFTTAPVSAYLVARTMLHLSGKSVNRSD